MVVLELKNISFLNKYLTNFSIISKLIKIHPSFIACMKLCIATKCKNSSTVQSDYVKW